MKTLVVIVVAALLGVSGACAHEKHEHAAGPGLFGQPPEYVHVLLNPLPIYGLGVGVLVLAAALFTRSKSARAIALGIIVVSSASAWPVQYYGENAYQHVRQISDQHGQHWLDVHMSRAEWIYALYATALLGVAGLVSQKKFPKAALPLTIATLVASGVSLGVGGWIGKAGGQIRHPEFRTESESSTNAAPHKHGTSEQSHQKMQHSDTSGGHKQHGPDAKQATETTPLPDTLEGVWKAIHEHHSELESTVSGNKFSDVQSHAEMLGALTKRLVELAHPNHKSAVESGVKNINPTLESLKQSAETGSELVTKDNFKQFEKALHELEQQMKKQ